MRKSFVEEPELYSDENDDVDMKQADDEENEDNDKNLNR